MANDMLQARPHRVALYWAPAPGSDAWVAGCGWLGRDTATGEALTQPQVPGVAPALLEQLTADPRRYGFHATLKAPFALAEGYESVGLLGDVEAFAATRKSFRVRLKVDSLDGFLALVPAEPSRQLDELAAACVREFDGFRAPLSEDDHARRQPEQLSEQEREYLDRWGYPYVFEFFRFHMTLTCRLEEPERGHVKAIL
jgi:putative phosphonate metabolism protein